MQLNVNESTYVRMLNNLDAIDLFRITDYSRETLKVWLPWLDGIQTPDDSEHFIDWCSILEIEKRARIFGVFYKDMLVGTAGFNKIDERNRIAHIGYWLDNRVTGKGIMTSVVKKLVHHGFNDMGLNRIEIHCATENLKSQHIPHRVGFTKEGVTRETEWLYDHYVDHVIYGLLKSDLR